MTSVLGDRKRVVFFAGVMIATLGFYGPWVSHKTAALTYNALDLTEFCKFMLRAGLAHLTREWFLVPIAAAAVALALWANRPYQLPRLLRIGFSGLAALLALVPLPPYPTVLHAYASPEDRLSLWLVIGTLACIALLFFFGRRIPPLARRLLPVLLALLGGGVPAWEFFSRAQPAISQLYGAPAMPGWGLWATLLGFALIAAGGLW